MNTSVPANLQTAFDGERKDARAMPRVDAALGRAQTIRMYGRLAALQAEVIARNDVAIACERGCSYCCHLRVEIRPHEAFVLAHHIETRLSAEERERTFARIEQNLARLAGLTREQHIRAGIPCALLDGNICSVYDARPAACRKYYSVSLSVCRAAYEDTSAPLSGEIEHEEVRLAGNAIALGHAKGLEDAGYDSALYELHSALHRVLTDPRAQKRYRNRKRAFVG